MDYSHDNSTFVELGLQAFKKNLCTYWFSQTLVLWTSVHVERLNVGGKATQQDWLKQKRQQN